MILVVLIFSFKQALSLSSFTLIKKIFSPSSLSAIKMVSTTYLRLLMFFLPILIPACNSSSLIFLMMCSAYRLNKQGDSRQHCPVLLSRSSTNQLFHTGFSNSCFLTHIQVSQETGNTVWYSHLFKSFPQFIMIHTVKGFGLVNETEADVFLEFPGFLL